MRTKKKAVSEILAAMLLITITFAAAIVVYVYSSGLLGSLQGAQPASGQYSNQITLEFYDWTNSGSCSSTSSNPNCQTLVLTLRNAGSGLAILGAFYVSGQQASIAGSCTTYLESTKTTTTFQPTQSCTATLTITGVTISYGIAYIVKVTTKNGGVFAYSCIAGQKTGSV